MNIIGAIITFVSVLILIVSLSIHKIEEGISFINIEKQKQIIIYLFFEKNKKY